MASYEPNLRGKAAFRAAMERAINEGVTRGAVALEGFIKSGLGRGGRFNHARAGQPPNTQRGGLRNSISHTRSVNFVASAGTNIAYGRIQETGGVIRARRGFLPIPLNVQAERLLELNGKSTEVFEGNSGTGYISQGGLRGVPGLHIERSRGGALLLVGDTKRKGRRTIVGSGGTGYIGSNDVPRFVLKRQVVIQPHPYIMPALDRNREAIHRAVVDRASRVFAEAGFGKGGFK